jgi:hypothetical protein
MSFGYWKAYPEDSPAGWGARAILKNGTIDIPYDRQGARGEKADRRKLGDLLNGGIMQAINDKVAELHYDYKLRPDQDEEHILHDSDEVRVIGNTNASYGYLYLLAYLK